MSNINQGNQGRASGRDYVESQINNNYYFSNVSRALKNYNKEIFVQKISLTRQNKKFWIWMFFFVFIILISNFLFPYFKVEKEGIEFKGFFLSTYCILCICFGIYIIFYVFFDYKNSSKLKIENDKLILTSGINFLLKKQAKEINYKDIRSFLKEKSFLSFSGTSFFIYKIDEIEPYLQFGIVSIHNIIAIEELLKYKISEAINIEKKSS